MEENLCYHLSPLTRGVENGGAEKETLSQTKFSCGFWEIPPPGQNGYCREDPNDNGGASIVCLHNKIIILAGNGNGEWTRKWLRTK